jgi:hypothetical protein
LLHLELFAHNKDGIGYQDKSQRPKTGGAPTHTAAMGGDLLHLELFAHNKDGIAYQDKSQRPKNRRSSAAAEAATKL